jgi:hypothetical protein
LVADGYDVLVCIRRRRILLGEGQRGLLLEVRGRDGGRVRRVGAVWAGREEWDCDCEFGGEEESQVEETCP